MKFDYDKKGAFYMRRLFEGFIENLDFSYDEDLSEKQRRNLGAHSSLDLLLIVGAVPIPPRVLWDGAIGGRTLSSSDL